MCLLVTRIFKNIHLFAQRRAILLPGHLNLADAPKITKKNSVSLHFCFLTAAALKWSRRQSSASCLLYFLFIGSAKSRPQPELLQDGSAVACQCFISTVWPVVWLQRRPNMLVSVTNVLPGNTERSGSESAVDASKHTCKHLTIKARANGSVSGTFRLKYTPIKLEYTHGCVVLYPGWPWAFSAPPWTPTWPQPRL